MLVLQLQDIMMAPPKRITFERKRFQPYLDKLGGDKEIEELFLLEFRRKKLLKGDYEYKAVDVKERSGTTNTNTRS